ncbi:type II secretion system protein GspF [Alkalilimnicola ehrlichii]|uniref:General secretion pathway protein F n=1 Tax=Alkalilimnicola ehrlichii TaxID=351052 RepID=A0A3E0X0X5_9GAMM|nr:type II secretion system inner membrane protein GspF [Alkalilimnicola ehrlichii]RFA31430.1 type II secretion system protein GspF [Alkalilimnicola ehrlichii]RFA39299.1 type II secretion system protein GspF [Alkalilimnicola ehrlichii]
MAAFEFQALDGGGKSQNGVLEGDTARQVRAKLRERGWIPLEVNEVAEKEKKRSTISLGGGGASPAEVALLTRQLATLIGSGLPLEEALQAIAQQAEKPRLGTMMAAVRSKVMEGHPLADGLALYPRAFNEMYRATVAAGEQTGHLDVVLERLADYTEGRQHMRQKIQLALFYPAGLLIVAVLVIILLLTYVVPKITEVFTDLNQELPTLTQAVIATSDFLRHHGIWLALAIVGGIFAFSYAMRGLKFRRRIHHLVLKLPLIGRLTRGVNAGRFARTFSILAGSGVPVLEALRISAQVISNVAMREAVEDAASQVREGTSISRSLERSGQFPAMMLHLINSGEASGKLEAMLERAAINQERETEGTIQSILAIFEPMLILTMGGIVLVIVLSILMPIFELNQMVG